MSQCLKPFAHPTTASDSELPPRTSNTTTAPSGPLIKNLGGGWFHVSVPNLGISEYTSAWGLPDVILAVSAIVERNAGMLVSR